MVIDDRFEIPEEIQKMSEDELAREIAILEKQGRKVAETLPDMEPLVAVQQFENDVKLYGSQTSTCHQLPLPEQD